MTLLRDRIEDPAQYPFSLPALCDFGSLDFHPKVTFFVGENGSGKSTLIEAIAVAAGFNAEGGSKNFRFATRSSESDLYRALRLTRSIRRQRNGFFLRAESFYNVATTIEELDKQGGAGPRIIDSYGGASLHEMSHGESFLTLVEHRFNRDGLYILDEPEAALSPQRQLSLLALIDDLVQNQGCQFIVATHSPIIMAYPDALIYELSIGGLHQVAYEETEHFWLTRDFLNNRDAFFRRLFADASQVDSET
jgi:predicted ATPase